MYLKNFIAVYHKFNHMKTTLDCIQKGRVSDWDDICTEEIL